METKGITCKVPLELHNRISEDIRETESTMSKFIEMIISEHYEKGANKIMENSRTLAFQVSEEFFQRVKHYLAAHPHMTQKSFVLELIENALKEFEAEEAAAATTDAGGQEAQEPADEPDADDTGESPDEGDDGDNTATEDDTDSLEADESDSGGWEGTDDTVQEDSSEPDEDDD